MLDASRSKRDRLRSTVSTNFSELPGIKARGQPRTADNKLGFSNGFQARPNGVSLDPTMRNTQRTDHQRTNTSNSFVNAQFGSNQNVRSSLAPPTSTGRSTYN